MSTKPMSPESYLSVASVCMALGALILAVIQGRQGARREYVQELATRVEDCERRHAVSERAREECERERERLVRLTTDLTIDLREQAEELRERRERDET